MMGSGAHFHFHSSLRLPRGGTFSPVHFHFALGLCLILLPAITTTIEATAAVPPLLPFDAINNPEPSQTPKVPTQEIAKESDCQPIDNFGCLEAGNAAMIKGSCPELQSKFWKSYAPRGQKAAGEYTEAENVTTPDDCAKSCCANSQCHYAFHFNSTCYLLNCLYGSYLCDPVLSTSTEFSMVSVRTPSPRNLFGLTCEVGEGSVCKAHQKCIPTNRRSRNGVCVCEEGFIFDEQQKECLVQIVKNDVTTTSTIATSSMTSTTAGPPVTLTVSVNSKNVTLPSGEVSLAAYVVPQAQLDHPYSYKWTLISNPPDDSATVEGHTTDTLRLTGFKEGKYVFQVTATSLESSGSANATINVFAEVKPNQAPIAVISPQEQTIQLPTSSAVLDASLSTDDDKIISYKWELQKYPILYTLNPSKSLNSSTLQVENLIPGNYTFRLIVQDSEGVTNSTTANVTVKSQPDYPPTANPGQDVVIYLPQTEVILNGNASTDDKKIVEWQWTATGDQQKAIDMQDTHTPYLKLSHLQVGLYQFELKVQDEVGQSSAATVHVVVKEATGSPPTADAGSDQTTVLNEQNWLILDGSKSKSESNKITHYTWTQLTGPNNATIGLLGDNGVRVNVSGLTKGEYEFLLVVEDESKLTANSSVKITVIQRVNEAPHAHAGGFKQVKLPVSTVFLDGSASTDDVKIVSWSWTRQPASLAAGLILKNTDSTPILQLTNLIPGKYVFNLTVKDEQGLSDVDTATLVVEEEPLMNDLIEIILGVKLTHLTESDKIQIIQQLGLLLHDTKLILHNVQAQLHTGNSVLQMHGEEKSGDVINGTSLAAQLRRRLYKDAGILQFPIYSIDTVLCLDTCSGHGTCQDGPLDGRECVCSSFWMENILKKRFGNKERNCEWSKIYVGVVVSLLISMLFALLWSLSFIFRRNFRSLKDNLNISSSSSPVRSNGKRYHSHKKQYSLIDDEEQELRSLEDEDDAESEDSDSDILFETDKRSGKRNGSVMLVPLTGNGVRNGILKNSRRVKT